MFSEDDLLPLSGLQHMAFCERRWALVHIEQTWEENRFTVEGELLHQKAHSAQIETRPGILVRRTLPVHSFRLGLSGQADIVEFHPAKTAQSGVKLPGRKSLWQPYPVEYKRNRDKAGRDAYQIQLCAQAMCLEEMLSVEVPEGAVYSGTAKRRQSVIFDASLRTSVEQLSLRMHTLFKNTSTPPPVYKKACHSCSLIERCLPESFATQPSCASYFRRVLLEGQS